MTEKIKYVKLDTVLIQMQLSNCSRSAIHDVAELPPEDVIERPVENWKHRKDRLGWTHWTCPICGFIITTGADTPFDYKCCPICMTALKGED